MSEPDLREKIVQPIIDYGNDRCSLTAAVDRIITEHINPLRDELATVKRERGEARADRLEKMMENERLKQSNGALCLEHAMLKQEYTRLREVLAAAERNKVELAKHIDGCVRVGTEFVERASAAEALLREAGEALKPIALEVMPGLFRDEEEVAVNLYAGQIRRARSLLARIKEAIHD